VGVGWGVDRWRRWSRRDLPADLVVLAGLAAFVGAAYVVIVVGVGLVVGGAGSPSTALSVVATAVVAVGFEPVRRRLRAGANSVFGRAARVPYDVLSHFASDTDPSRMARVLADGVGAAGAQVWLMAGGRLRLAGAHPAGAPPVPDPGEARVAVPGRSVRSVRQGAELLGVLVVEERECLTPVEAALLDDLAAQAGLVLRNLRLTAELQDRLRDIAARADLLRASRIRVVASEDRELRQLERDIHDGAQQHLVALAVNLRLAQTLLLRRPDEARELLAGVGHSVEQAAADLQEVMAGRPWLLAESGLVAALRVACDVSPVPVELVSSGLGRYAPDVERALYYCCLEALQNVAKHAAARGVVIELAGDGRGICASIREDGRGFAVTVPAEGGLAHMVERVEALGGTCEISSVPGRGTAVRAVVAAVPLGPGP
jgi:signal transduction histidine kinase